MSSDSEMSSVDETPVHQSTPPPAEAVSVPESPVKAKMPVLKGAAATAAERKKHADDARKEEIRELLKETLAGFQTSLTVQKKRKTPKKEAEPEEKGMQKRRKVAEPLTKKSPAKPSQTSPTFATAGAGKKLPVGGKKVTFEKSAGRTGKTILNTKKIAPPTQTGKRSSKPILKKTISGSKSSKPIRAQKQSAGKATPLPREPASVRTKPVTTSYTQVHPVATRLNGMYSQIFQR